MKFKTQCPECKKELKFEGEYKEPVKVECKCGCSFNYTKGMPIKRPDYLDIVIHGVSLNFA